MILVDTCVWSLAFRRSKTGLPESEEAGVLRRLIAADENICLPGIVLQEILSGVREESQFNKIRRAMAGFPIILATQRAHVEAARIANRCRSHGIAVSPVDCLVAAIAIEHGAPLFTTDKGFNRIGDHCSLLIYQGE